MSAHAALSPREAAPARERPARARAPEPAGAAAPGALRLATRTPLRVQRRCACGGGDGAPCACEEEEAGGGTAVQRAPVDGGAAPEGAAARGVLVDDGAAPLPGQVRVGEFLARLEDRLRWACDLVLAATGRSTADCPYLDAWLAYYRRRTADQVERAARRYAATDAGDEEALLDALVARARRAALEWAATSCVVDVPDEAGEDGMPRDASAAVQARAAGGGAAAEAADPVAVRARLGRGSGLDPSVRGRMEAGFGRSFGGVRVHTDAAAARTAAGLRARAFTVGSDVAFGAGEYRPGTLAGDALIAHELAHTVQQSGGGVSRAAGESRALEAEADAAAAGALGLAGARPSLLQRAGLSLQRCRCDGEKTPEKTPEETPTLPPGDGGTTGPGDGGAPDATPAAPPPLPAEPAGACGKAITPDGLVIDHRVEPDRIEKPGDEVTITVTFACVLHKSGGGKSMYKDSGGATFIPKTFGPNDGDLMKSGARLVRKWSGKRPFANVGTYIQDGDFTHQLDGVKYAISGGKDLNATAANTNMVSPPIHVATRGYTGTKPHHHYTPQNVTDLAAIINSEIGIGNADEQKAVAWAVRNQMLALNTPDVAVARAHFRDADGQGETAASRAVAEEILKKPMSDDTTSRAIKWYSPYAMPSEGEKSKCSAPMGSGNRDCRGGLVEVANLDGKKVKKYAPSWAGDGSMTESTVAGVRAWHLRLFHL